MNAAPLPRLFSVAEVAEYLGRQSRQVQADIRAGLLGCYRLGAGGRKVRIAEHHIIAYLEQMECQPKSPVSGKSSPDSEASSFTAERTVSTTSDDTKPAADLSLVTVAAREIFAKRN